MEIITLCSRDAFQSNTYVLFEQDLCVVIDPGGATPQLLALLSQRRPAVLTLIATHGHIDHVSGVADVQGQYQCPFFIDARDRELAENVEVVAGYFGVSGVKPPREISILAPGTMTFSGIPFAIIDSPGHSPGGVCFQVGSDLFVGDSLFQGSIGRTDLPGGDYEQLIRSITRNILPLQGVKTVYPGHGPTTTLEREAASNPFLRG